MSDNNIDIKFKAVLEQTSILDVCTQIRTEASKVFYSENIFYITDAENQFVDAEHFIQRVYHLNAQNIAKLVVRFELPQKTLEGIQSIDDSGIGGLSMHVYERIKQEHAEHARSLGSIVMDSGRPFHRITRKGADAEDFAGVVLREMNGKFDERCRRLKGN